MTPHIENNIYNSEKKSSKIDHDAVLNTKSIGTDYSYKHEIVWKNAIGFLIFHVLGLWGMGIIFTGGLSIKGFLWGLAVIVFSTEGVTIGAHRYYTHKSFKATPLLRAIFIIAQTIAGQNSMFTWCRDHRLHHRYADTDADPHNSKRGFFFCHIGWLMMKKHPHVIELGRKIYLSDLEADWMVTYQKKYYYLIYVPLAILVPIWVPVHYFGDTWLNSFLCCYVFRTIFLFNGCWLVNSAGHLYGTRPYDQLVKPITTWMERMRRNGRVFK